VDDGFHIHSIAPRHLLVIFHERFITKPLRYGSSVAGR
jgi:hypothetical protein